MFCERLLLLFVDCQSRPNRAERKRVLCILFEWLPLGVRLIVYTCGSAAGNGRTIWTSTSSILQQLASCSQRSASYITASCRFSGVTFICCCSASVDTVCRYDRLVFPSWSARHFSILFFFDFVCILRRIKIRPNRRHFFDFAHYV